MRIAIVVNTSWNISNFRMGLIQALQAEGHEIHTVAPEDPYTSQLLQAGCRHHNTKLQNKGSNPLRDLLFFWRLYRLYNKIKPDIILHYTIKPNIYGTFAARLNGIPCINNVSGLGTVFLHHTITSRIAKMLYRWAFRYPAKIFFQNQEDRQLFLDQGLVKAERTDLLPGSGVNLQKFSPQPFRRNKPMVFLMIARLLYDKGIREYVEAGELLRQKGYEFSLQVAGAIEEDNGLGVSAELVVQWVQTGKLVHHSFTPDIRSHIANADVIVLPSYREGTPKSLLEGGACGKPLLASDVPGCREVVQDGYNGYLFKVKDPIDLAQKMEKMLNLEDQYIQELGNHARHWVSDRFDERLVITKYLQGIHESTNI